MQSLLLKGTLLVLFSSSLHFQHGKAHAFKNKHPKNTDYFPSIIPTRHLLNFNDQKNVSSVQINSTETDYNVTLNHSASLVTNTNATPVGDEAHKNIHFSIPTPKIIFYPILKGFRNYNKSEAFNTSNSDCQKKNDFLICPDPIVQNKDIIPINGESIVSVIDIRTILNDSNAREITNNSLQFKLKDKVFDILTEDFDCVVNITYDLRIFCVDVDIYSLGEYLPNDTAVLKLSYSIEMKLLKPLFPHLENLKSLTLTYNHHRYITRAFMGLNNLEILDLSNNDIIVVLNAFTYIPRLRSLNLSTNQIRRVRAISNAVSHLKNLESLILDHNAYINYIEKTDLLNLKNCNISLFSLFNTTLKYIENGSFSFMPNLKILELSVNYLNERALANVTCGLSKNVEVLYFGHMLRMAKFPITALKCLTNTKVKKIHFWYNYFKDIPVLPSLPYLELISLSNCSITGIEENAFANVPEIESIYLKGNKLTSVPPALSSAVSLKELYIETQNVDTYDRFLIYDDVFQNLTNLRNLSISRLRLEIISRNSLNGLNKLKYLFLSKSYVYDIEDYAFETLTSLQYLDLNENGLTTLRNFTFYGLNKLKYLYLMGNHINFLHSVYPFQFSPSLYAILLEHNDIELLPEGMFFFQKHLILLHLGKNKLVPWTKRTLHPNTTINVYVLSQNNIDYISEVMLHEFHQVTDFLSLGRNPFNCSKCGMKEFQSFCLASNLRLKPTNAQADDNVYNCINPPILQNQNFFEIELPVAVCVLEAQFLSTMTIILMCCLIIFVISVTVICYIFRWYIRYWIFHIKTIFKYKNGKLKERNFIYDAFIIYSSFDTDWVITHLITALEKQEPRYKLCVHERDFLVGRLITENILEAIENSRKVIVILSKEFIKSEWCMYELHLSQHRLFGDTRDILILVKLEKIDKKLYSKNLLYVEKTRHCFQWTENQVEQMAFWEQIRKQLGQPIVQRDSQTVSEC